MRNKLITVFFCVYMSCSNKPDVVINFPDNALLISEVITENEEGITFTKYVDSLLIISKKVIGDGNLFSIYDSNEKLIIEFGKIGSKSNEFSELVKIHDYQKGLLYVFDYKFLKLVEIDLEKSTEKGQLVVKNTYLLPDELLGTQEVFLVQDSIIVGLFDNRPYKYENGGKKVFKYNLKTKDIETTELKKYKAPTNDVLIHMNINSRVIDISKDRSKLVIASVNTPLIEVYDIEQGSISELNFGKSNDFNFSLEKIKNGGYIQYYRYIHAEKDKIYALYSGEIKNKNLFPKKIHVYDWNGNPLKEYELPKELFLSVFDIDSSEEKVIGFSYSNDRVYNLKEES